MKIDLKSIDSENFSVAEREIGGEKVFLVQPKHGGCVWNKSNLIFRSSVWDMDGNPISLSFKKFFNWGESNNLAYTPFSLAANGGVNLLAKKDGSCLSINRYHNNLVVRTRGTVDATVHENGLEIDFLRNKYPAAFDNKWVNSGEHTMIFEWTSPKNIIIVNYGQEPDLWLTGIIRHEDYSMVSQAELDKIAADLNLKRPERFTFNSIKEMLAAVEKLDGQEGICVYCNHDQDIRKVKSAWYLAQHKLKNDLNTLEKVLDLFLALGRPDKLTFEEYLNDTFDFELAQSTKNDIELLNMADNELHIITSAFKNHAEQLRQRFNPIFNKENRKKAAREIIAEWHDKKWEEHVFMILDGKELEVKNLKKLMLEVVGKIKEKKSRKIYW